MYRYYFEGIDWVKKSDKEEEGGPFIYIERHYAYILGFILGFYYKKVFYMDVAKTQIGFENWECVVRSCKDNEDEVQHPHKTLSPIIMQDEDECRDVINNTIRKLFLQDV